MGTGEPLGNSKNDFTILSSYLVNDGDKRKAGFNMTSEKGVVRNSRGRTYFVMNDSGGRGRGHASSK